MATNDFVPVAPSAGANVLTQAQYLTRAAVTTGYTSGVAESAAVNKSLRQATLIAAVVAQLTVDATGQNAVDDGTTATLLANLKASFPGRVLRRLVYFTTGGVQNVSIDGAAPTTVGATTFTKLALTTKLKVRLSGAGGGGGGSSPTGANVVSVGGGGGAGGFVEALLTSGFSSAVAITAGVGGAGGTGNVAGTAGGASTFGALMSAGGGGGGLSQNQIAPPYTVASGNGGTVTSSAPFVLGGTGQPGGLGQAIANTVAAGGFGATSGLGFGGGYPALTTANGGGGGTGAGGAGAVTLSSQGSFAGVGGNGGTGVVIIEELA